MAAVAFVALLCLLAHRRRSFARLAEHHESRLVAAVFPRSPIKGLPMGRGIRGPDITAEMLIYKLGKGAEFIFVDRAGKVMTTDEVRAAIRHEALARKYRQAARYPWFPVGPDPPELEGPE